MQSGNPFEQTILVSLTVKQMGTTRKVSSNQIEVEADKDMLRVSKRLLECPEIRRIQQVIADLRLFIKKKTIPARFVKEGIYAIPIPFVELVEERLRETQKEFDIAVDDFLLVYPDRMREAVKRLNVLGSELDYPSPDEARKLFSLSWEYITMGPPATLEKISKEIWAREKEKAAAIAKEEAGEVIKSLRLFFQDSLEAIIDKLTPDPDGSRKALHDSRIKQFQEFLNDFSTLNICGDTEMQRLVEKTKGFMMGKSREVIKDNAIFIKGKLEEIKKEVSEAIVKAPVRAIRLPKTPEPVLV